MTYYSNLKIEDVKFTLEAWHYILRDYEYNEILGNLLAYVKAGERFAPSVGQLLPQKSGRVIPTAEETNQFLLTLDKPKELPTADELNNIFEMMDEMLDAKKG